MDTKELEYLIAVYEEGSIAKAALRLYMAQSSLSQAISVMETRAGVRFFVRTSTGVRLTSAGEAMISYAYKTLDEYRQLKNRMQDMENKEEGSVRLGISSFRGSYFLPPVFTLLRKRYPNIHVEIVEANSMALETMLSTGNLDLAMLVAPLSNKRIKSRKLMEDEICLIVNKDHPVLAKAHPSSKDAKTGIPLSIALKDTGSYEYLLGETHSILGREGRRFFNTEGIRPLSYNSELTALFAASLAAEGAGIAFTYYSSRHYFREAEFLSLDRSDAFISLVMGMPPGRYHSHSAEILNNLFFEVYAKE